MNRTKLLVKTIFAILTIGALSGCTTLNSSFDCKMKPGVNCKSLDQVNKMVEQGKLGKESDEDADCPLCKYKGSSSSLSPSFKNVSDFTTPYPTLSMVPPDPVRYGETVLRVWIAPYEDKDGNYYQPTTVYTVVKNGHWIGNPVKAVNSDGDRV